MLRIATVNELHLADTNKTYSLLLAAMQHQPLDILFGQTACVAGSDPHSQARDLAQSLKMTYMYSNSTQNYDAAKHKQKKKVQTGFSLLTGKECWMLNSGSLSLTETKNLQRQVQFGVIRINSNSVLVINVRFTDDNPKKQLLDLLNHPLHSQQFGAIIINSNLNVFLGGKATKKVLDSKGLTVHLPHHSTSAYSSLSILTSKGTPLTSITVGSTRNLPFNQGQVTELEMIRLPKDNRRKRYQPLSFRERWLGSRDGYRAFAY
ncbi:hypothetical protein [Desulfogranum marinum]|uniref:hypothetical protein n=1 Tax=Desulfogranum marinum TaxID=453220 RepID=UPI0019627013|nr:hypothetical protein [Desulfogranum marinum]MBM9514929.1 hypothetical protein [Desulfogranum marinum]